MKVAAHRAHPLQKIFVLDDLQEFQGHAAGERSASKGGAVFAGAENISEPLPHQECAQRQTRRKRLGNSHHIRRDTEVLEGEHMAGASQAALDLIKDKHRAVSVGCSASGLQKFCGAGADSAFALNRLEHDGADRGIHRIAQSGSIVQRDKFHLT